MLWLAPAGLRGGLKLETCHQSRQPHSLSVALNVLGLWFALPEALRRQFSQIVAAAVLFVHRCSDSGFVSRQKPAEHQVSMFLQLQTMRRHVSRPVAAGVPCALKDAAASWLVCSRGADDGILSLVSLCSTFAREATPFSKLFQGGTTTHVLQWQPPFVLHDTLHWPRASSFQLPWGRGVGSVLSC